MLSTLADQHCEFAFIVEHGRRLRTNNRFIMRYQRGQAAHENRWRLGHLVPAFLGVFEIVETKTHDLTGFGDRKRIGKTL